MKRWRLLVKDVNGTVIHSEPFLTRYYARKTGYAITSPPLNHFEIERNISRSKVISRRIANAE